MDVNPTAVVFLQSLIFLLQLPKQRRRDRLVPPLVAGCAVAQASVPPTTPTAGQGIPLLTHTPCYSAATAASHRSRTGEPSYSSPRGLPLPRLPRLRVVPFLGLAIVQTTALVLSARRCQRPTSIERVLYVERLTTGSRRPQGSASLLRAK